MMFKGTVTAAVIATTIAMGGGAGGAGQQPADMRQDSWATTPVVQMVQNRVQAASQFGGSRGFAGMFQPGASQALGRGQSQGVGQARPSQPAMPAEEAEADDAVVPVDEGAAGENTASEGAAVAEEAASGDEGASGDGTASDVGCAAEDSSASEGESTEAGDAAGSDGKATGGEAEAATEAETVTAANTFVFTDAGIATAEDSTGYKVSGTALTINTPGTYTVTGSCSEGSITVKKGTTGVTLVLSDLDLACSTTAPLAINKDNGATTVQIEGAVTLTDAESLENEESDDFEGAAIKVKSGSALSIAGSGTLNANGACKNGIKGASGVTVSIDGATVNVGAANNGVASDGEVVVNAGALNVVAGNDGMKAEPDEGDEASAGTVTVNGGEVDVQAAGDGIQATGGVTVNGGDVYVEASEDGVNSDAGVVVNAGEIAVKSACDGIQAGTDLIVNGGTVDIVANGGYSTALASDADSCKGLKAGSNLAVNGGLVRIDAADDAVHSNGGIQIAAGTLTLLSGDDGVHADGTLDIGAEGAAGPSIAVTRSYEGLEGQAVNVNSGQLSITASDDGINAANSDLSSGFEMNFRGGTVYVDAGGDGIDSNGPINMYGGYVEVFGAADNGNSAIDFGDGSTWNYYGGTMVGVGMSGMAEVPTTGAYVAFGTAGIGGIGQMGSQPGQMQAGQASGSFTISAGSSIAVKDSSGNVVYAGTGVKSANSVVLADDAIASGQAYTLYVNGSAVATSTAVTGNGQAGAVPGGTGAGAQQPGQAQQGGSQQQPGQQGNRNQASGGYTAPNMFMIR